MFSDTTFLLRKQASQSHEDKWVVSIWAAKSQKTTLYINNKRCQLRLGNLDFPRPRPRVFFIAKLVKESEFSNRYSQKTSEISIPQWKSASELILIGL